MPHDGDARGVLNGPYERVTPARDDEVNVPVLCEQCGDLCTCLDSLYKGGWEFGADKCGLDRARERSDGACGLLAAL